jgi:hypothetical protein
MEFELYWKDYKRFGPDGASSLLSRWLKSRIVGQYGSDIQRIFVCGYCRSLSGPNQNLQPVFEQFNTCLATLRDKPEMTLRLKKKELEIRYATVWPTADEYEPDSQVLKLGTFTRSYKKLMTLLGLAGSNLADKTSFDFGGLVAEIKTLEAELPRTLDELVLLYSKFMKKGEPTPPPYSSPAAGSESGEA